MIPSRPAAALVSVALLLTACGGGDADESDASSQEDTVETTVPGAGTSAPTATAAPGDGPVATVSPEVPEDWRAGIGPLDVIGEPLPVLPESGDDPAVGMPVPVLVGLDLDGRPLRIDPAADGPAMVVFVAHWCPHCNDEIPRLNALRDAGRFPPDLDIVAVSTAARPDRPNWPPTEWLTDTMGWTYPALLDGVDVDRGVYLANEAWGVSGFPFVVVVDGDGDVLTRWSGEREEDEIVDLLTDALG